MVDKDRLIGIFGTTLGAFLYLFAFFSSPLAIYGIYKGLGWGIIGALFAYGVLVFVIPLGEIVTMLFAVYGLIKLFS